MFVHGETNEHKNNFLSIVLCYYILKQRVLNKINGTFGVSFEWLSEAWCGVYVTVSISSYHLMLFLHTHTPHPFARRICTKEMK